MLTSDEIRETFLSFFEERDHLRIPSASLVPADARPLGAAHHRGHAPAQALLPGPREAAAQPRLTDLPEVLPHDRHRERRQHRAPPHVLRDARQLLDRRLLQARRGRVRVGALARGLRLRPRATSGSRSSRATTSSASAPTRRRSRPGRRSACRASGSSCSTAPTTSGRPARPGRAARARSSTSTAAWTSAAPDDLPGRRQRALPGVLEPRVHAVRPGPGRHAHAAAGAEHRHRPRAQPHGGDPAGRRVGVRDRPVQRR